MLYRIILILALYIEYHLLGIHYLKLHRFQWIIESVTENFAGFLKSTASILILCGIIAIIGALIAKFAVSYLPQGFKGKLMLSRIGGMIVSMVLLFGLAVFVDLYMLGT